MLRVQLECEHARARGGGNFSHVIVFETMDHTSSRRRSFVPIKIISDGTMIGEYIHGAWRTMKIDTWRLN